MIHSVSPTPLRRRRQSFSPELPPPRLFLLESRWLMGEGRLESKTAWACLTWHVVSDMSDMSDGSDERQNIPCGTCQHKDNGRFVVRYRPLSSVTVRFCPLDDIAP